MLIYRIIVICFSFISFAFADCVYSDKQYKRGKSLFDRGQFLLSSIHFSNAISEACPKKGKYQFYYSKTMFKLNEIHEAQNEIDMIARSSSYFSKGQVLKSIYLDTSKTLSKTDQQRVHLWKNKNSIHKFEANKLNQEHKKSYSTYIKELNQLELKSPGLAAGLSILPGAGQAYLGAYQSAGVSFVLNSLFLMSAKDFERRRQYGAAGAAYLVFSVTYLGNIISAYKLGSQYNNNLKKPAQDNLYKSLFSDLN